MKKRYWLLSALFLLWIIGANSNTQHTANGTQSATASTKPTRLLCDASPKMQAQRKTLLEKLKTLGLIQKVATVGTLPRVYVLPAFQRLTFDDKKNFMNAVHAYLHDCRSGQLTRIYDAITDKALGTFDENGLSM